MSLAINVTTAEGIVLSADSRQSYRNRKGMARIGSDSVSKVFRISNRIGAATTGLAFLPENGVPKNISKFIEEFKQKYDTENMDVAEVATVIHKFFDEKYDYKKQLETLPEKIKADFKMKGWQLIEMKKEKGAVKFRFRDDTGNIRDGVGGVDRIDLLVAGFNSDNSHEVYTCRIPGEVEQKRNSKERGKEYGASWIGQIDVVSRIVLGWDGRIGGLPFVREAFKKIGEEAVNKQLRSLEYVIQWGTMTLQDAIDFSTLAINTASAIQRFSDGIQSDPGDVPGVGGPVDVAVITPAKGFVWINKKNLKVEESEVDLDKLPDLPPIKPKKKKK